MSSSSSGSSPSPSGPSPSKPPPSGDAYHYNSIDAGVFRVLLLLEADNFDDDLECAILEELLSDIDGNEKAYTALSYAWGLERDTHRLYIDDKFVLIGANLNSALRHLRRQDRPLRLWVDALCINQTDFEERRHQVHQMRRIYQSAQETIVYLGDQTGSTTGKSAWNFLERNSTWALNDDQEKDYNLPAEVEDLIYFRGDLHDVYHDVLSREWFQRIWVLQEVVVSKEVSIQCGHRRIPGDDLFKVIMMKKRAHDQYGESLRQENVFESIRRMWQARVTFQLSRGQEHFLPSWYRQTMDEHEATTDILDMLVRARELMASDERDKIFALLGISTGFDWEAKGTINYAIPASAVFTKFARDFLVTAKDYRLLSYLNAESRVQNLQPRIHDVADLQSRCERAINAVTWIEDKQLFHTLVLNLPASSKLQGWSRRADEEAILVSNVLDLCTSELEHLRGVYRNTEKSTSSKETLHLPSWVPHWQCTLSATYEPRAIIETIPAPLPNYSQSMLNIEEYRTFAWDASELFVHGSVIGRITKALSPASLLGKDEAAFDSLKKGWQQHIIYQEHPLDAQILTMWAHFLDATAFLEEDSCLRADDSSTLNAFQLISLRRRAVYQPQDILAKTPGSHYPSLHADVSFLEYIDVETCPPTPGSVEAHLVARAHKTTEWSDEDSPALTIVRDRDSIVDRRLVGVYEALRVSAWPSRPDLAPSVGRSSRDRSSSNLILLPPTASFNDLVVYFPGAKVPFLVRPTSTSRILTSGDARRISGDLPHLTLTEQLTTCELIGECWINNFDQIAREQKRFDFVFKIV